MLLLLDSAVHMDPRNRLWNHLIFPWCGWRALLVLRAVCTAFRAQLDKSQAWLQFTMVMPRMRYDERLLGWRGVEYAIQREHNTRANCDAGRFARGPVLHVPGSVEVRVAGGRIAVFFGESLQLFDAVTGAQLALFDIDSREGHKHALLDRWVAIAARDGRVLLLDCVVPRLVEIASADVTGGGPLDAPEDPVRFSVSGPCVSFHWGYTMHVTVMRVEPGAVAVQKVARVTLSDGDDEFALCEGGGSYLLRDKNHTTLQLIDLASGQPKRVFTPRASLGSCAVVGANGLARATAANYQISYCTFFDECNFVVASILAREIGDSTSNIAFRINGNPLA